MTERKPVGKKLRFEVFKRDNFTCQYCGAQAPDVVLHVDHINPVAGGGDNDIMNLITSCESCNLGKGARELDDQSVLAKQRQQIEDLNQRREQLEMMLQWREGLSDLADTQVSGFDEVFQRETGCHLNDVGKRMVKGWLKKHTIAELLDGLEGSLSTYYKDGHSDPEKNNRLAGKALNQTIAVVRAKARHAQKPYMKDLYYTRAIIRNRMHCNEWVAIDLLEQAYVLGAHIDELKDWAKRANNWTNWRNEMEDWIGELQAAPKGGEQ